MDNDTFIYESMTTKGYMIEADEEIGEFIESEDGVMLNLYWSNTDGWVPSPVADIFEVSDYFTMNLPMGGHWVECVNLMSVVMSSEHFVSSQVTKINRNFVVHPEAYQDDNNFRVV